MYQELLHRRFKDEFDRYAIGSSGSPYWVPNGGTWTVTALDEYRGQTTVAGHRSIRANLSLKDLRAEIKIKNVTAWGDAFLFRAEAGNEYNNNYHVRLQDTVIVLDKMLNGVWSRLDFWNSSFSLGTYYTIEIHCKGDSPRIQVYVNGTLRMDVTDSSDPHTEGVVGLGRAAVGSGEIYAEYIDIWGIERGVIDTKVHDSVGSRIKAFSAILDNVVGFRTGRYAFNDDIEVWRGTSTLYKIFGGFCEDIDPNSEEGLSIRITGRDYGAHLLFVTVLESYTARELSVMLKDLIDTYAPHITYNHVQTTPITLTAAYKKRRLFMVGREFAAMATYAIFVDDEKDLWFIPETYQDSGKTFEVGTNILNYSFPTLGKKIINRVTVYGAQGIAVQVDNLELQDQMKFIKEETITDPAIQTEEEARRRAKIILYRGDAPRVGQIDTLENEDLNVGELVTVKIPKENIDGQYLVLSIDYQTPEYPPTRVTVAEYLTGITEIIASLKEDADMLMRAEMDLEATLSRWVSLQESLILQDTKLTISKKTASDSFIIGNPTFGVLGSQGYGLGDRSGAWVVIVEEVNP